MVRIKIPRRYLELEALAKTILAKHVEDGENSVLKSLVVTEKIQESTGNMIRCGTKASEAERLKEELIEERKLHEKELTKLIVQVRNLLKAHYPNDQKKLGAWGFDVDENTKKKSE